MPSPSHPVERFSFSTALFGMLVLTLGMGLGRFLYTPMLPVMMAEGSFSFSQLSWIASGNYAGYLAGSLLFSFGAFHQPSRLRPFLLASALASGLLILAMAWLLPFILVLLIRVLAGVASAGMLIFGSTLIMQHTRHPFVLAALFSGVGIGIALGNEYVLAGLHFDLSSQTLWQGAGALSGMMLIALTLLMPSKKHAITPMPLAKTEQQIMSWWLLAILYGLAGFGYIIVATYLPLMAKDAGSPLLTAHLWTLVGLSIVPGCFGWLWAAKRWGALPCLTANLLVQAICVLLTLASDSKKATRSTAIREYRADWRIKCSSNACIMCPSNLRSRDFDNPSQLRQAINCLNRLRVMTTFRIHHSLFIHILHETRSDWHRYIF